MKWSRFFWILTILTGSFGFVIGTVGVYFEVAKITTKGLYMIVLCGIFIGLASILATLAAKYEAEKK